MRLFAFTIYFIFSGIYVFLIFSINSQVKKYILPHDSAVRILNVFIFGAVVLLIISAVLLFLVPWNNLNFNIIMPEFIPFYPK